MRLADLAIIIRSKNAGPFELTLDVIFEDAATYGRVVSSGVINERTIAALYGMDVEKVLGIIPFEPAYAIKVTVVRPVPCGNVDDTDIYGAQQHAPLMELEVPD